MDILGVTAGGTRPHDRGFCSHGVYLFGETTIPSGELGQLGAVAVVSRQQGQPRTNVRLAWPENAFLRICGLRGNKNPAKSANTQKTPS